jgi:hypothetical protein
MRYPITAALIAVALFGFAVQREARAENPAHNTVNVRVESVLATDTHKGMDATLASSPVGRSLKSIFDYSTYHLLKRDEEHTIFGQAVAFNLPGGRILHVAPIALEGNMIAMELVLFEGAHLIMRTQLKLLNHGALILVGPRAPRETYITTIATETSARPQDETEQAEAPPISGGAAPAILPSTPLPVLP